MIEPSCLVLVKNESYFLPFVLAQTIGHFDSYVIYDVGSTDNTRDIIQWFIEKMDGKADFFVRYLPHVPKEAQGAFRNSQIVEGQRKTYMILDGDELYTQADLAMISRHAENLKTEHDSKVKYLELKPEATDQSIKRFGVFKRIEVLPDLTQRYNRERNHHRLYTRDAFWTGNHPGEVSGFEQNSSSELEFPIRCWHLHNTVRSPKEADALLRLDRKNKRTYHPDSEGMSSMNLLKELPILQKPIESFPVSPALAVLQAQFSA